MLDSEAVPAGGRACQVRHRERFGTCSFAGHEMPKWGVRLRRSVGRPYHAFSV
jgi:hypothetical protein